jgi:hypothetical protein
MPFDPQQLEQAIQQARDFWDQGRVSVVDLICQSLLTQDNYSPEIMLLLGQVAGRIGEFATARRYLQQSQSHFPDRAAQAIAEVNRLEQAHKSPASTAAPRQRFHLIKAWGYGFTSDLDHTLGHLLIAQMENRIPVIHWGDNSLFRDANVENAWTQFFEPVSPYTIADLLRTDYSFYPGKWSAANLRRENVNKWEGPDAKTAGITYLNQTADVTVADYFTAPIELLPWLVARNPLSIPGQVRMMEIEQGYRFLIDKYLKPMPWITAAVDQFAMQHFGNRRLLAVHMRGSDKVQETPDLALHRQTVFQAVQADLANDPSLSIFLLTDDVGLWQTYKESFPGRVIATDCVRSSTLEGIHYSRSASRSQLGFEVLRDAYLAARCERFIGVGTTNVSNFIMHLKAWPNGAVRLAGPIMHHQRSEIIV